MENEPIAAAVQYLLSNAPLAGVLTVLLLRQQQRTDAAIERLTEAHARHIEDLRMCIWEGRTMPRVPRPPDTATGE